MSCCGKSPLGTYDEERDVDGHRRERDERASIDAVAERPAEAALVEGEHAVEDPLGREVEPPVLHVRLGARACREHIIGVSVSETSADMATATLSVTANSRKRRPTMPPMSRIGTNTASERDA